MIGCAPRWLLLLVFLGFIPGLVQNSNQEPATGVFTANTVVIPIGGCVTLSWNYPDAISAELRGSNWPTGSVDIVDTTGSTQACPSAAVYYVPAQAVDYTLTVYYADGSSQSSVIMIMTDPNSLPTAPAPILMPSPTGPQPTFAPLPTPTAYPTNTPARQLSTATLEAYYQPFEYGFMLQLVGETCVYAFSTQANAIIIPRVISSKEGGIYQYCLPPNTGSIVQPVPEGLLMPGDTFLPVWSSYAEVQESLGFATGPEIRYTGQPAHDDPVVMGGIFYLGIITLPDGRELRCGHRGATAGTCTVG